MTESAIALVHRARFYFNIFAPAVLACNGDVGLERAALARPSVGTAHLDYLDILRELHHRDARSNLRALNEVYVSAALREAQDDR